jgi:hypothetical protein
VVVDQPVAVPQHAAVGERAVDLAGARRSTAWSSVVLDVAHAATPDIALDAGVDGLAHAVRAMPVLPRSPADRAGVSAPATRAVVGDDVEHRVRRRVVDLAGFRHLRRLRRHRHEHVEVVVLRERVEVERAERLRREHAMRALVRLVDHRRRMQDAGGVDPRRATP